MLIPMLRNLASLAVFCLVAYVLVLIGLALLPVIVTIACLAIIWYVWKVHSIRKEIEKTMREHGDTSFHSTMYRSRQQDAQSGETIEVEYEVVETKPEKKD